MDKKKERKIPECSTVSDLTAKDVVVGAKQLKKAVNAGRAECVYLALNADPALTDPLAQLCGNLHIQITWVRSMAELGRACGIDVGAAAAAVIHR